MKLHLQKRTEGVTLQQKLGATTVAMKLQLQKFTTSIALQLLK